MNILKEIAERTRARVAELKRSLPLDELMDMVKPDIAVTDASPVNAAIAEAAIADAAKAKAAIADTSKADASPAEHACSFPFENALRGSDIAFICEIKKASPSKGIIAEDFPYRDIAMEYETAGASAISVLTEPYYFQGSDGYLREIADRVSIPLLRKDFIVDSYMIYQAKLLGASAVLLICAILDQATLAEYIGVAHSSGLSALVEAHDEDEVKMAVSAGARVIGVNNRDLRTFEVDLGNSVRLRKLAPEGVIFVSESGVRTAKDVHVLRQNGVDAVLVGEALMRSPDIKAALSSLMGYRA